MSPLSAGEASSVCVCVCVCVCELVSFSKSLHAVPTADSEGAVK